MRSRLQVGLFSGKVREKGTTSNWRFGYEWHPETIVLQKLRILSQVQIYAHETYSAEEAYHLVFWALSST